MAKNRTKISGQNYWRVTLYLSKRQDYSLIKSAAKVQNLTVSRWLMLHALNLARLELQTAQAAAETQPSNQSLVRAAKTLKIAEAQ